MEYNDLEKKERTKSRKPKMKISGRSSFLLAKLSGSKRKREK